MSNEYLSHRERASRMQAEGADSLGAHTASRSPQQEQDTACQRQQRFRNDMKQLEILAESDVLTTF